MDKNILKSVLFEQKAEAQKFPEKIIKREKNIEDFMKNDLVKVIMGARRSGKSTLARQMLEKYEYGYVNFDDERLAGIKTEELNDVLETILTISEKKPEYLFFDEIQNVSGWELFVNRLKRQGYNIIVTGSNSKLLSRELATHLTGRHAAIELYPFSFKEFLSYRKLNFSEKDFYLTEKRAEIKKELDAYISTGGFPETFDLEIKEQYLRDLYQKIITQDIIARYNVKYIKALKELSLYIFSNISCRLTYHKLKNIFEIKSVHTIKNYLEYLEEAYLIFQVRPFSFKAKEQMRSPKKIYAIDHAFARAASFQNSENLGQTLENVVFIELKRREKEIYYFADYQGNEVDFLVRKGLKITDLIQVSVSLSSAETKKREVKSLLKASKETGCDNLMIVTMDEEGEEVVENKKIKIIPLYKFLLLS